MSGFYAVNGLFVYNSFGGAKRVFVTFEKETDLNVLF